MWRKISLSNTCVKWSPLLPKKKKGKNDETNGRNQKTPKQNSHKKLVQNASALEKLAAAHQSVLDAPHSQGIWVASMMPTAMCAYGFDGVESRNDGRLRRWWSRNNTNGRFGISWCLRNVANKEGPASRTESNDFFVFLVVRKFHDAWWARKKHTKGTKEARKVQVYRQGGWNGRVATDGDGTWKEHKTWRKKNK